MTMASENITGWQIGGHGIFEDVIPGFRLEKRGGGKLQKLTQNKRQPSWKTKKELGEGLKIFNITLNLNVLPQ